jgi:hypothetical protein
LVSRYGSVKAIPVDAWATVLSADLAKQVAALIGKLDVDDPHPATVIRELARLSSG